jgi:hypothetical protein
MILTCFEKVKAPDPFMDVKLNFKAHLQQPFFDVSSSFVRVWLQGLKKVQI